MDNQLPNLHLNNLTRTTCHTGIAPSLSTGTPISMACASSRSKRDGRASKAGSMALLTRSCWGMRSRWQPMHVPRPFTGPTSIAPAEQSTPWPPTPQKTSKCGETGRAIVGKSYGPATNGEGSPHNSLKTLNGTYIAGDRAYPGWGKTLEVRHEISKSVVRSAVQHCNVGVERRGGNHSRQYAYGYRD